MKSSQYELFKLDVEAKRNIWCLLLFLTFQEVFKALRKTHTFNTVEPEIIKTNKIFSYC